MTDVAKRLTGPALLTAAAATQYTVPASTTTVVRNVHITNTDTVAHTFTLSVGADAAGTRIYHALSIPAGDTFDWSGFLVVAAAEIIQAYADVTSTLAITLSGIEITGTPAIQAFTPTWTGSSTNPVLGNGTFVGRYQMLAAKLMWFSSVLTVGSTTTFGSGTYRVSLPAGVTFGTDSIGTAVGLDAGTSWYRGGWVGAATASYLTANFNDTSNNWTPTVPWTLAVGDILRFSGVCEIA